MRLFITGATGLIGRRLVIDRLRRGDQLTILSRDGARASQRFAAAANPNITVIQGDPSRPGEWMEAVDGCEVIVHLAGAPIASRWDPAYKRLLRTSRVDSTHHVVRAIEEASTPPGVLLTASAIGYYGGQGDQQLDEGSPPGSDFLARLCVEWEAEAAAARTFGTRVVSMRIGMVLDDRGGALPELMKPFRWMLGGRLGSGRQWMSWIHHRDVVGLIDMALRDGRLDGPLNLVSPHPERNAEFMKAVGRVLRKPAWAIAPRFMLRMLVGELADHVLQSTRVMPVAAQHAGYHFLFPELEQALASLISDQQPRLPRDSTAPAHTPLAPGTPAVAHPAIPPPRSSIDQAMQTLPTGLSAPRPGERTNGAVRIQRVREKRASPRTVLKLVAIDVDGTLLKSDGSLPTGVAEACRAAQRNGCLIVPATARPPRAMRAINQSLGVDGPAIHYNGAVIWHTSRQAALFHQALDHALAAELIAACRDILPEIIASVEILDRNYTDRIDPRLETQTSKLFSPDFVGPLDAFLTVPITKINLMADPDRLAPVMEMIRTRYWSTRRISVFLTDPHLIQVAHPMVDKGVALQRIARHLKIEQDAIMAIGDGSNDAGMLEWAGFSVAMANAWSGLHELADAITTSNEEQGVARALGRFVISGAR